MTIFHFLFHAEANNVATVRRAPGSLIFIAFTCTKCGQKTKSMGICPEDRVDIPCSRGDTNMHYNCKGCSSRCNIDVVGEEMFVPDKVQPKGQQVVRIECRGSLQPNSWCFDKMFVTSTSGAEFSVSGEDKDWCDYDENLEEQVELMEMMFTVE